jgi:hypothetical protein
MAAPQTTAPQTISAKESIMRTSRSDHAYYRSDIGGPHCVVKNCAAPVVAEVFNSDYAITLEMFRGVRRETVRSRRAGDERLHAYAYHLEHAERVRQLQWQTLMFHRKEKEMSKLEMIVSRSGTRHIVGTPPGFGPIRAHGFCTTTVCGCGIRPEEALPLSEATRDCEFCLRELAVIEQREDTGRAA